MSREAHVRFWERAGVKLPCATHLHGGVNSQRSKTIGTIVMALAAYRRHQEAMEA
jgi:hypothetical protein